jgi:hypothetical protein
MVFDGMKFAIVALMSTSTKVHSISRHPGHSPTDPQKFGRVALSQWQYAALRIFTDENKNYVMTREEALSVDQRSFGSIYHKKFIVFDKERDGFVLTPLGKQARQVFENTTVFKEEPGTAFSHFIRIVKALNGAHRRTA